MKQYIKRIAATLAVVAGVAPFLIAAPTAQAAGTNVFQGCAGPNTTICDGNAKLEDQLKSVINVLLYLIGIIAVIMIIIGGIRYVTSNGDSSQTKSAKDTILYAVIGLVIAILAFAIVNFVVGAFS